MACTRRCAPLTRELFAGLAGNFIVGAGNTYARRWSWILTPWAPSRPSERLPAARGLGMPRSAGLPMEPYTSCARAPSPSRSSVCSYRYGNPVSALDDFARACAASRAVSSTNSSSLVGTAVGAVTKIYVNKGISFAMRDDVVRLECEGLLFDLDGVLVDSTACVERSWRTWAAQHGLDASALLCSMYLQ